MTRFKEDFDEHYMAAAIRLARRHEGLTAENPSVGALLVRFDNDQPNIVGTGVTARNGRPHAETIALHEAGEKARGACAYVTLEPCSHFGQTPPCAQALIDAGIARVVVAMTDPDPRVSGRGLDMLRNSGLEVVAGVLMDQAEVGLAGFLSRQVRQKPFVTLKMAMSADGLLGVKSGRQVKITGEISNGQVHLLRAMSDAILIGSGTVLNDDPSLTCRLNGLEDRSPVRVILDRRGRITEYATLVRTAKDVPTILVTQKTNEATPKSFPLDVIKLPLQDAPEPEQLRYLLSELAARGLSTLLVEGGASVANSFLQNDLVDRIIIFQSQSRLRALLDEQSVHAPLTPAAMPEYFTLKKQMTFGTDICYEYLKK